MGDSFKHDSLNRPDQQIRLLSIDQNASYEADIRCSMTQHPLNEADCPSYTTVSYVWGDQLPDAFISINERQFSVTKHVERLLKRCRKIDVARLLWIDAICIDQTNNAEKSHQIALMRDVYQKSTQNCIYLGDDDEGVAEMAAKAIAGLKAKGKDEDGPYPIQTLCATSTELKALEKLYANPWFRRLWVVQEAVLPNIDNHVCYWGGCTIPLKDIWDVSFATETEARFTAAGVALAPFLGPLAIEGLGSAAHMKNVHKDYEEGMTLSILLGRSNRNRAVTKDHDRVYGLLGMTQKAKQHPIPQLLRPDYGKPLQAVYRDAFRMCCITSWELGFLEFLMHESEGPLHLEGFPSWVPRLDLMGTPRETPWSNPYIWHIACWKKFNKGWDFLQRPADPNVLEWPGFELGRIVRVSPRFSLEDFDIENPARLLATFGLVEQFAGSDDETVARLLVCNEFESRQMKEDSLQHYAIVRDQLRAGRPSQELSDGSRVFIQTVRLICLGRRLVLTDNGHHGLAPPASSDGDTIAVWYNCRWPVVLRRLEDPKYHHLIGPAFIGGIMRGEAMEQHLLKRSADVRFYVK